MRLLPSHFSPQRKTCMALIHSQSHSLSHSLYPSSHTLLPLLTVPERRNRNWRKNSPGNLSTQSRINVKTKKLAHALLLAYYQHTNIRWLVVHKLRIFLPMHRFGICNCKYEDLLQMGVETKREGNVNFSSPSLNHSFLNLELTWHSHQDLWLYYLLVNTTSLIRYDIYMTPWE